MNVEQIPFSNFKNMHKNDLKCEKCSDKEETQEHVMMCKEWEEFWKDLNRDEVIFFHRFEKEKARINADSRFHNSHSERTFICITRVFGHLILVHIGPQ